jgi:hypothetical protein
MTDSGPVEEALLDGYGFGDRLLEGVMFRIILIEGKINCPGLHKDSEAYGGRFTPEQVAKWQLQAEENCRSLGDNLVTEDGQEAWIEIVEADPSDPLAGVHKGDDLSTSEDSVDSWVDPDKMQDLWQGKRDTVRPIEAESFGDISKRIVGKLTPR